MDSKVTLLKKYIKSNKKRRVKIWTKAGFENEDQYLSFLKGDAVFPQTNGVAESTRAGGTDIVIVFDTTGSMSRYIGNVKAEAASLIDELFDNAENLRIAVVAHGDYCDMTGPNNFGEAYQQLDFTADRVALKNFILNAKNTSGGDGDEFYELVIKKVAKELSWREGSNKSVTIFADANPHRVGYSHRNFVKNNQIDWEFEAINSANKGISWDCFRMRPEVTWWKELAEITGGKVYEFNKASNTSNVIKGAVYARGGSKEAFTRSYTAAASSGDKQLMENYATLLSVSKEIIK